jgi:hypothetical protein
MALPFCTPGALIADKGYDSDAIRDDLVARGITPVIPGRHDRQAGGDRRGKGLQHRHRIGRNDRGAGAVRRDHRCRLRLRGNGCDGDDCGREKNFAHELTFETRLNALD